MFSNRAKQLWFPELISWCGERARYESLLFSMISFTLLLELQNECECKKGFRGNGIDCEPITSCLEQTEKCHPLVSYLIFLISTLKQLLEKERSLGYFLPGPSNEQNLS